MGLFDAFKRRNKGRTVSEIVETEGFRIATPEETYGDFTALYTASNTAATDGSLLQWADAAAAAIAADARLPYGIPFAAVAHKWPSTGPELGSEAAAQAYVAPFVTAYQQRPTAFTAAMLSEAFFDVADDFRGDDWSDGVSAEGASGYQRWNQAAGEVLKQHQEEGQNNISWLAQQYSLISRVDPGPDVLQEAFEQLWAADRTNLYALRFRGIDLLPRWYGTDKNDVERFARWAVQETSSLWGAGAYGFIYGALANIDELDVEDTVCDVPLLDRGYSDLREAYPCTRLANEHANAVSWADAEPAVMRVFDGGLRAIDPTAWGAEDDAEGMGFAVGAYATAQEETA